MGSPIGVGSRQAGNEEPTVWYGFLHQLGYSSWSFRGRMPYFWRPASRCASASCSVGRKVSYAPIILFVLAALLMRGAIWLYMMSSTWWLNAGGRQFPSESKTSWFSESWVAIVIEASSDGESGLGTLKAGIKLAACSTISTSNHFAWLVSFLARPGYQSSTGWYSRRISGQY